MDSLFLVVGNFGFRFCNENHTAYGRYTACCLTTFIPLINLSMFNQPNRCKTRSPSLS